MMPDSPMTFPNQASPDSSCGGRIEPVDPGTLPLRDVRIATSARGGMARVVLEQRFHNPHAEPLSVSYLFPLPEGAAVSGYAFTIGDRRIVGEVDKRAAARERFEQAITEGKSAALLDQERPSLFTQEIGNIPPGADVVAEVVLDQPLRWLDEGSWEWRFPLASAPRYLGAPGRVPDAARVMHSVSDRELAVRASLELRVRDEIVAGRMPESPSHPTRATDERGAFAVRFDDPVGAALDRDLVVRWSAAAGKPGMSLDVTAESVDDAGYGLLTLTPPLPEAHLARVPRDVILLMDTSGSMRGAPLDQARRVASALVDTLTDTDRLEMLEFGSRARRWKSAPAQATEVNRSEALAWLASLRAGGSTEMRDALEEAMSGLRSESQRQVVLVTDGQIGFESEVVAAVLMRLPAASRIHTVGVGSAVNRSLTGPLARAGRGVEVVIGLGEDPEKAARRVVARTDAPLVVDLHLSGSALLEHAPSRLPDLFARAPVLVSTKLRAEGGDLVVRGRTASGEWTQRVLVPPRSARTGGPGVRALFAREKVEDLEMRLAAGEDARALDAAIETVGIAFQIATRLTSWVAVTEERTVDPQAPTRRVRVPQNLPYGMSIEGLGLRAAAPPRAAPMMPMAVGRIAASPTLRSATGGPPPAGMPRPPAPARAPSVSGHRPPPPPTAPPIAAARPTAGVTVRRAEGRLVTRKGDELVIEVTVEDTNLDWIPANAVEVELVDGTRVSASIVVARSTRAGTIAVGTTLRLILQLHAPSQANPSTVTIPLRTPWTQLIVGL